MRLYNHFSKGALAMLDDVARVALEAAKNQVKRSLEGNVEALKHDPRMSQIIETHQALNKIEDLLSEPKTPLAQIFGLQHEEQKSDKTTIRPDEFYGFKPLDAAKLFLKKKGRACSLSEIAAGIRSGGGIVDNEDDLGKALARSTFQIAKIGDNYGLLEFYPHIQRGRGSKKKRVVADEPSDGVLETLSIAETERDNEEYDDQQEAEERAAIAAAEEGTI
jgi:hypothetical protein